jgi:hypothetical protein
MLNVLSGIQNVTVNEIIHYISSTQGKEVYVIDVYRTPIERKMSEFFEKISPYHFNNTEDNISNYKMSRITDRFNKLFPHLAKGDHYFDKYNIPNPIPFDFNKKYTLQEYNNVKYIKLRLCDSKIWNTILTDILKVNVIVINDYQTERKSIGEFYKKFKQEYKLPSNYIDLIADCTYFNYYYSYQERENYLNMWTPKLDKECIPYTDSEYRFYVNLYLENQHINDIQLDHYIDNGCYCDLCNKKRRDIYLKAQNGEKITEKIIHSEVIHNKVNDRNKKLAEIIKKGVAAINSQTTKFKPNQFTINHNKR